MDPDAFLAAVRSRGLQPLAIRPLTLAALLKTFKRGGELPADPVEVYAAGCQALCREPSTGRNDAGLLGQLPEIQRLQIAEQIAAVSVFCGRTRFFLGMGGTDRELEDGTIGELTWGTVGEQGAGVPLTREMVREVLGTGLFSGRSGASMGWAHATFADYLAARFVVSRGLEQEQLSSLLFLPPSSRTLQLRTLRYCFARARPGSIPAPAQQL